MKKSIIILVCLLVSSLFVSCAGVEERRLAQAHFMTKVADNPKEFGGNYFNLNGYLTVGHKKSTVTHYYKQLRPQDAAFQRHQAIRAAAKPR